MSRCLVLGGAGFIGSHVGDLLVDLGHEVVVVDDLSTGKVENISPLARFVEADICEDQIWEQLDYEKIKFDYVFHLAALARIQPSIDDPIASNRVNLLGTLKVLEYCRKAKAKIIFSSSSSVYEGTDVPTNELGAKKPISPYAMQKLMSEQYIRLYRELYGVEYAVLRYFNVYGERQILNGAYAAVVGIFLDQKSRGEKLTITGDGEQKRDFTYVKDVAEANVFSMEWQGTFNIGTGENYSINQIAEFVGGKIKRLPARPGEARITLADNSKAVKAGWEPTVTIRQWINDKISG